MAPWGVREPLASTSGSTTSAWPVTISERMRKQSKRTGNCFTPSMNSLCYLEGEEERRVRRRKRKRKEEREKARTFERVCRRGYNRVCRTTDSQTLWVCGHCKTVGKTWRWGWTQTPTHCERDNHCCRGLKLQITLKERKREGKKKKGKIRRRIKEEMERRKSLTLHFLSRFSFLE